MPHSRRGLCPGWIRDMLLAIVDGRLEDAGLALFPGCDPIKNHIVEIGIRSYPFRESGSG